MARKAIEQRWKVKPEWKDAMIQRLVRIIADPKSTPREVTSASRTLIAAEGQNQSDDHHEDDQSDETRGRLLALSERLRIGPLVDAQLRRLGDEGASDRVADPLRGQPDFDPEGDEPDSAGGGRKGIASDENVEEAGEAKGSDDPATG